MDAAAGDHPVQNKATVWPNGFRVTRRDAEFGHWRQPGLPVLAAGRESGLRSGSREPDKYHPTRGAATQENIAVLHF